MAAYPPGVRAVIETHQLSPGSSLILPARTATANDALSVIIGGGRGCTLEVERPVAGLWAPLRGRLQISGGKGDAHCWPAKCASPNPSRGCMRSVAATRCGSR